MGERQRGKERETLCVSAGSPTAGYVVDKVRPLELLVKFHEGRWGSLNPNAFA